MPHQPASRRQGRGRRSDPARRAAFDVLRAVADRDAYANLLLPALLRERGITGRDAAFATELTYGTLRGQGSYDAVLAAVSDRDTIDPAVRDILRLGAHQLLGTRTGAHAAVATSVDLAREVCGPRPSGFVNAVLRRVATRDLDTWLGLLAPDRTRDDTGYLSVRHSYPRWIVEAYRDALGERAAAEIEQALAAGNIRPEVTLAILPPVADGVPAADGVHAEGVAGAAGAALRSARWSPFGATLADGGDPAPLIAAGYTAVQDEASQLVALALTRVPLETGAGEGRWLDMCAGPGGKARLLAYLAATAGTRSAVGPPSAAGGPSAAGRGSAALLAAELRPQRAERVREALAGVPGEHAASVIVADGLRPAWRAGQFARVLADVPCTGLGSLRRRPEARWRKTEADLGALAGLQRDLLATAIVSAQPGGVVAYVTCSPHVAETRDVVTGVLRRRTDVVLLDAPAFLPEIPDLGTPSEHCFAQFWPHRHGTDAMFLALLRKL